MLISAGKMFYEGGQMAGHKKCIGPFLETRGIPAISTRK